MELDKLIVTGIGFVLIGFIYWFFFGKKDEAVSVSETGPNESGRIDVVVDGGYKPSIIKVKKGVETTLKLKRVDSNTCLEEIILPDFKIKSYLPLNEEVEIKFTPQKIGEFGFHCGMNMYHGKIIVE